MGLRDRDFSKPIRNLRRASLKFGQEMLPLIEQLPSRLRNPTGESLSPDFRRIEAVAAALSLSREARQERGDAGPRIGLRLESSKLRVMAVASGCAGNDFLRQQGLAPGAYQALRVEILRVECPKSHWEKRERPL